MIKKIILSTVVLVVTSAVLDILLLILRPDGAERLPALMVDEQTGWVRSPNQHGFTVQRVPGIFRTHFQTNNRGMRDREYPLEKCGKLRILALGDSVTEGWGVEENETYPKVLEAQYLSKCEVWNLGVVGFGTDQELQQLRRVIDLYQPEIVTLAFYYNDLADNSFSRALWPPKYSKPHFELQDNHLVLANAQELHRQKLDADREAHLLTTRLRSALNESALYRLTRTVSQLVGESLRKRRRRAKTGGAEPGPEWWRLDNFYRTHQNEDLNRAWKLSERLVVELDRLCVSRGVSFILTYVPGPADGIPGMLRTQLKLMGLDEPLANFSIDMIESRLADTARRNGIRFVPTAQCFRSAADPAGLFLPLVPRDGHIGAQGHQLVARVLAEYLRAEGIIPTWNSRPQSVRELRSVASAPALAQRLMINVGKVP